MANYGGMGRDKYCSRSQSGITNPPVRLERITNREKKTGRLGPLVILGKVILSSAGARSPFGPTLDSFGRRSVSEQRPHRTSVLSGGAEGTFCGCS